MGSGTDERLTVAAAADISVVGFDDQPDVGYFDPPLTTVNQCSKELG